MKKYRKILSIIFIVIVSLIVCVSLFFIINYELRSFKSADFLLTEKSQQFKFDLDNINDIGSVYHYEKSNINGSLKTEEYIFIANATRTESFKIYPNAHSRGTTDLIIAEYDPKYTCIKKIEGFLVNQDGKRIDTVKSEIIDGSIFKLQLKDTSSQIFLGYIPSFLYNFDFADFIFMYRHLIDKESPFDIGVIGHTLFFKFLYAGKSTVKFLKKEVYSGYNCRSYSIYGEAFGKAKGKLYFDSDANILIDLLIPVSNNPSFNSLRFRFIDTFKVSAFEWNEFIINKTREVMQNNK